MLCGGCVRCWPSPPTPPVLSQVLALREARVRQEAAVAAFQKGIEALRRDNDAYARRERQCDAQLAAVEADIEAAAAEKRASLHRLTTAVPLRLSQIRCLVGTPPVVPPGAVTPVELASGAAAAAEDPTVVFPVRLLGELRGRATALGGETAAQQRRVAELRQVRASLVRTRRQRLEEVAVWESRVRELEALKFGGRRVDLDVIEGVLGDRAVELAKADLRAAEARWASELKAAADARVAAKQRVVAATAAATQQLRKVGALQERRLKAEAALSEAPARVLARVTAPSRATSASKRARLGDLVLVQQQEIDALKAELAMLRRKGGHVYTSIPTPPPPLLGTAADGDVLAIAAPPPQPLLADAPAAAGGDAAAE